MDGTGSQVSATLTSLVVFELSDVAVTMKQSIGLWLSLFIATFFLLGTVSVLYLPKWKSKCPLDRRNLTRDRQNGSRFQRIPKNHDTKIIYVHGHVWGFRFNYGRTGFINNGCPVSNCLLTKNRSLVPDDNFDAVLIHLPTFNSSQNKLDLPNRKPNQVYIMYSYEPPTLNGLPDNLDTFEGYFNRSMTYLSGSDYSYVYGKVEPLATAPKTEAQRLEMMARVRQSSFNPAKGKTKLVAWMVTNWWSPSNRDVYVKYLRQYMEIDVISENGFLGGRKACPRYQDRCYEFVETDYKFYLAFENSICNEYVTEKFFGMLARNIVPVVLGGANYSAIAPPHSYINALDYTPRELAQYLLKLDKDDRLYAEYFWWKPHYKVYPSIKLNNYAFCEICADLHANPLKHQVITGLHDWYYTRSQCIWWPVYSPN